MLFHCAGVNLFPRHPLPSGRSSFRSSFNSIPIFLTGKVTSYHCSSIIGNKPLTHIHVVLSWNAIVETLEEDYDQKNGHDDSAQLVSQSSYLYCS